MSEVTGCVTCGAAIHQRGRRARYCSVDCRREEEFRKRRDGRVFDCVKRRYESLGETEVRARLAEDLSFVDEALDFAERYMPTPAGQPRISPDEKTKILAAFSETDYRAFQVVGDGHDTPLPSSADIDAAAASGDWSAMEADAAAMLTANKAVLEWSTDGHWPADRKLIETAADAARV